MTDEQIRSLLEKRKAGTLTAEEKTILESWYIHKATTSKDEISDSDLEQNLKLIGANLPLKHRAVSENLRTLIKLAASILVIVSIGGYFLLHQKSSISSTNIVAKHDIAPGENKATLTLANGEKVILNESVNGQLAKQAGVIIHKNKNGELTYIAQVTANDYQAVPQFNILQTARGEQYQVVLPDGSHVWLNAASSIKYPTIFTGKSREVELTGEAYFEIAKDPQKPFRVHTNDEQEIEVLGTHFNVEAYADDSHIKTTLLEGSVKLLYGQKQSLLVPGQIAVNNLQGSVVIEKANIEEVMAWKNGLFVFNNENIKDVMKKAARWYNVDVTYLGDVHKKKFGGIISRYKNITELLDNMTISDGMHYKIKGRRVILMN